jgi:hypothetical protein
MVSPQSRDGQSYAAVTDALKPEFPSWLANLHGSVHPAGARTPRRDVVQRAAAFLDARKATLSKES